MKKCRGLLALFLMSVLLLTGCEELFPRERSYSNVRAYMSTGKIYPVTLTDEEKKALCELVMNEPLQEISAEEAAAEEAGVYGGGFVLEFTCGLKHYEWYIRGRTVSCTIKPLVGKETTVYYLTGTLRDEVNDFLHQVHFY